MCVEERVGLKLRGPCVSRGGSAKNLLHMVGRDPNNTVCVAKAPRYFDIFINTVWAPSFHSGDVVAVWMCSAVVDLSRSLRPVFLPATLAAAAGTEPSGGLRLRSPRRLPSPQKWCQDNGGRGRCVRLGTSCENSKQLSGQISATRPLRRACLRLPRRCRRCLWKTSVVTPSVCWVLRAVAQLGRGVAARAGQL